MLWEDFSSGNSNSKVPVIDKFPGENPRGIAVQTDPSFILLFPLWEFKFHTLDPVLYLIELKGILNSAIQ